MAGKKSVIETGVDKLVNLISERKKVSVKEAAKELGVSMDSVEEWADFLEEEGIISIQSQFATVYLVEKKLSKKEVAEKVKAVKEEKESFMRRVDSSINALQRDHDEIKLIDSEFQQIKSMLEDKFSKLHKKLDQLEDFRKTHKEIGGKVQDLESDYENKLKEMDKRLKKEEKEYHDVMQDVEDELKEIKSEREKLEKMKTTEKELESRVDEINRMIGQVKKEIDKENEQLEIDEKRLDASQKTAEQLKKEIESTSRELGGLSDQFKSSRKEIESMEKDFLKDIESIKKGDLSKVGPYRESKEIVDKFKKFFDKTKEIEGLITRAEKEESELKEHFEKLAKKVQAFTAVTSVPEIKKEMSSLQDELKEIEKKKSLLGGQLKKLRGFVRSVLK